MSSVALPLAAQAQTTHSSDQPAATQPPLTAAQAKALSTNVTDKVIVLFKNQFPSLSDAPGDTAARSAAVASAQSGVLSQLAQTHSLNVKSFSLINAVSATVSPGEAKYLAANPLVSEVVPDLPIPVAGDSPVTIEHTAAKADSTKPLPGACASGKTVQLDPEAIENIHAATQSGTGQSAQALGYTGAGVKVAFIADGVNPDNPDFIRANGQHVFVDYKDFSGTGTAAPTDGGEAFLDSSSIAAQGREVYNVASWGGFSTPCRIRILGVAPGASLVGLNVFGSAADAYDSVFLEAINYAVSHDHVNVINESFGDNPFPDSSSLDLTELVNDAAVKAGVVVDVSSGDAGPTNTIGSPATDPHIISAGATTTYRAYAQTGVGDITAPGVKGWIDNNISGLSSGGFAQNGATVDVVAPGDLNWALCTADPAKYADCTNFSGQGSSVELSGGTSEAAPLTSGVAALVIQAYRKAHGGATPSPAVVKQIIVSTAENVNAPANQQGAGMLDAYQAVLAAASYHLSKPTGHTVLESATQLNAVGQPGTAESFAETLTNNGSSAVTVGLSSRTLSAYAPILAKSLSLTKAGGYAATVTFTVPPGQARLNASLALVGLANISLIAPDGDLAEYNLPQGIGNYGNAQVADPAGGKWTALISSDGAGSPIAAQFQASTATWQSFGSLSAKSVALTPGASGTVTLTVDTPAQAGDADGSIMLHSSASVPGFAVETSIPVTLRSLVPTPDPSTTVVGTLTGGNGRETSTGQTAYYQVDLPSGRPALNASIDTGNAGNTVFAELIDPSGNAVSAAANGLRVSMISGATKVKPEVGTQLHAIDPTAGVWTVAIDFYNTVSGTAVDQPFTVSVNDTPVTAAASGLPDGSTLTAGTPTTASVTVTNNGTTPEAYFVDARLSDQVKLKLAAQSTSTLTLPDVNGVVPQYLVPSHSTALTATASASSPVFFDVTYPYGDPDVMSSTGKTATASYSASPIGTGDWTVTPFLQGPFGAAAAKKVTAHTAMTVTADGFDSTVSSPTGDLWLGSTDPSTPFTPYIVNPGQTVTIPVTITPAGKSGSTVTGTLYVCDSSFVSDDLSFDEVAGYSPEGSDVAAFPYSYKIG